MDEGRLDRSLPAAERPAAPGFRDALRYWLQLGFVSFGGPAGQISMMHQELVEKRRWISERRFLHALNYTMLLPGPEAQQLATYIGWLLHGVPGGVAAGVLFVLPSFLVLCGLSWVYLVWGNVPAIAGVLYGIKPAVTAIVAFAAYRIGTRALSNNLLRAIAALAFVAITFLKVPFPYIVLLAGIAGFAGARLRPALFSSTGHAAAPSKSTGPALLDDDSPIPDHARFGWRRFFAFAAVGFGIWTVVMAWLVIRFGWQGTLTQMGWFFSKAALVTFGGAYAVLPYVYQGGVESYGWLSPAQMIDGLALGETTPGPLIMVVAFVGFVGGWSKEVFGTEALMLAGIAGAGVATLFTFLPSFLFIFLGGPAVEATRGNLKFTAPLTGITAAVVGVILSLATFFAYHVLWPQGFDAGFEWFACWLGAGAFIALFRYRVDVIIVIAAAALLGFVRSLLS